MKLDDVLEWISQADGDLIDVIRRHCEARLTAMNWRKKKTPFGIGTQDVMTPVSLPTLKEEPR